MSWWIYKCNSRGHDAQIASGDWEDFFKYEGDTWGSTEWTPSVSQLKPGDMIIAYQTDRNEIVGLVLVTGSRRRGSYIDPLMQPLQRVGVKVRPLKQSDPQIARIPALQPGPIRTLYDISEADAKRLLRAAGIKKVPDTPTSVGPEPSEDVFIEGEKRARQASVRSRALREAAKEKWGVACYCCGFEFEAFYGRTAAGAAIVHHRTPFDSNVANRKTTVNDVRIVCANCHYFIHMSSPPVDVDKLRKSISRRWVAWSDDGIQRQPPRRSKG